MGISNEFRDYFSWFNFDKELWDLIEPNGESTNDFISSLDCYVYNSHYKFTETQCRATIESMLLGVPVIAPNKDNFINQIWHGKTGLLYQKYQDVKNYAKLLEDNKDFRLEVGEFGRLVSKRIWCDAEKHIKIWEELFTKL
jgi:glycosyltransferase involved in cell wall biosynthesis